MGLSNSRKLGFVHPALAERLRILGQIADFIGSKMVLISGLRTVEQQQALFDERGPRPVARPGCSQHQYGWAMDVSYFPALTIGRGGEGVFLSTEETFRIMDAWAQELGLSLVPNDSGHYQIFPNSEFKTWAVASGFCDPTPIPPRLGLGFILGPRRERGLLEDLCGPLVDHVTYDILTGFRCVSRAESQRGDLGGE